MPFYGAQTQFRLVLSLLDPSYPITMNLTWGLCEKKEKKKIGWPPFLSKALHKSRYVVSPPSAQIFSFSPFCALWRAGDFCHALPTRFL